MWYWLSCAAASAALPAMLPDQLQRQLNGPRLAGREDLPYITGLNIRYRPAKSRRVGEVEKLTSELQSQPLAERKVAHHNEVPILEGAAIENVAAAVAKRELLRHAER